MKSIYINDLLHQRLKVYAATHNLSLIYVAELAIDDFLVKNGGITTRVQVDQVKWKQGFKIAPKHLETTEATKPEKTQIGHAPQFEQIHDESPKTTPQAEATPKSKGNMLYE